MADVVQTARKYDFGPATVAAPGFVKATPATKYSASVGAGWEVAPLGAEDYGGDPILKDFVRAADATWRSDVPNGAYYVHFKSNDNKFDHWNQEFSINGQVVYSGGLNNKVPLDFTAWTLVTDGTLRFRFRDSAGKGADAVLNSLEISSTTDSRPIPPTEQEKAVVAYKAHALDSGKKYADFMIPLVPTPSNPDLPTVVFYDWPSVAYQFADYFSDPSWNAAAVAGVKLYRDQWVIPNKGGVNGYYVHSKGLRLHYERTGDALSKQGVIYLANGTFSGDSIPNDYLQSCAYSREAAFALETHADERILTGAVRKRSEEILLSCFGHIDQWCDPRPPAPPAPKSVASLLSGLLSGPSEIEPDERKWSHEEGNMPPLVVESRPRSLLAHRGHVEMAAFVPGDTGPYRPFPYYRPFMVGLTCEALIKWYDLTQDARIPPYVLRVLNLIWSQCWVDSAGAFKYTNINANPYDNTGDDTPNADDNLLIVPAFAWAYLMTGDTSWRDRADAIFIGGVRNAWLGAIKQFTQNYRWSLDYFRWRSGDAVKPATVPFSVSMPTSIVSGVPFNVSVGLIQGVTLGRSANLSLAISGTPAGGSDVVTAPANPLTDKSGPVSFGVKATGEGKRILTFKNDVSLPNPDPVTITVAPAPPAPPPPPPPPPAPATLKLEAPGTATVGVPFDVKVSASGVVTKAATVVLSVAQSPGAVDVVPSSIPISGSVAVGISKITCKSVGMVKVSATNDGGMTNPAPVFVDVKAAAPAPVVKTYTIEAQSDGYVILKECPPTTN